MVCTKAVSGFATLSNTSPYDSARLGLPAHLNLFSLDDDIGLDIEAVREALAEGTGILTMEAPWKTASIVSPFAGGR
jgi:hypothetical protein